MSADDTLEPTRPRGRRLTTLSVAVAVLLAGGGGAYWASTAAEGDSAARDGAREAPPPLVLSGYGGAPEQEREGAAGIAPGEPDPRGKGPVYRADGPLPDGPETAPAYRPAGGVGEERVAGLADALEIPGEVRKEGDIWRAGGEETRTLTVNASTGAWSFSGPVPDLGGDVSEEAAKRAAAPVIETLGLQEPDTDAGRAEGGLRIVSADPRQDGLPTHGWTTEIAVGPRETPVSGSGRLAALKKVGGDAEYPVMNAGDTLAALNERSGRMSLGLRCGGPSDGGAAEPGVERPGVVAPDAGDAATEGPDIVRPETSEPKDAPPPEPGNGAPCGPAGTPEPMTVTDAVFGLSAYLSDGGRQLLVPSWLFEVESAKGSGGPAEGTHTVAYPAVEPEFLKSPKNERGDGSTGEPAEPGASPEPPLRTVTYVEEYEPGDRSLTVHFWGGVCDDHTVTARESGDTVRIRVTHEPKEPGRMCILVAKELSAEVTLDKPVGDRALVDDTGERVPEGKPREE